jgi:hypothetical protein
MPYYRHKTENILYSLPDNPIVSAKIQGAKHAGWTILGSLEVTHPNDQADRQTDDFVNPITKTAVSNYGAKDSRDDALRDYFLRWVPDTIPITEAEYRRLQQEYLQPRN